MEEEDATEVEGVEDLQALEPEPVKILQVNKDTEVPNIQTCQLVSGWGVLYISAGEKVLIFVQNLRHALGRISSLPSQPKIENLTSPARPLQE